MAAAQSAFRAAVERFDVVLSIDPTFGKALLLKGVACQQFLGRADEGLAMLQQFVRLRPEVGEGHLLLGRALASLGKTAEARESLRRAADLAAPGDRRAADALAALSQP
jgi:Flp pilus assembly protein TadD